MKSSLIKNLNVCFNHQKITSLCLNKNCMNFRMCSNCDHSIICGTNKILLDKLESIIETAELVNEEYNEKKKEFKNYLQNFKESLKTDFIDYLDCLIEDITLAYEEGNKYSIFLKAFEELYDNWAEFQCSELEQFNVNILQSAKTIINLPLSKEFSDMMDNEFAYDIVDQLKETNICNFKKMRKEYFEGYLKKDLDYFRKDKDDFSLFLSRNTNNFEFLENINYNKVIHTTENELKLNELKIFLFPEIVDLKKERKYLELFKLFNKNKIHHFPDLNLDIDELQCILPIKELVVFIVRGNKINRNKSKMNEFMIYSDYKEDQILMIGDFMKNKDYLNFGSFYIRKQISKIESFSDENYLFIKWIDNTFSILEIKNDHGILSLREEMILIKEKVKDILLISDENYDFIYLGSKGILYKFNIRERQIYYFFKIKHIEFTGQSLHLIDKDNFLIYSTDGILYLINKNNGSHVCNLQLNYSKLLEFHSKNSNIINLIFIY